MYTQIETLKNVISTYDETHDYHADLLEILSFVENNQTRRVCSWSKFDVQKEIKNRNKELPENEQIVFTEELADAVLDYMEEEADAGNGYSWNDISVGLDKALEEE